MKKFFCFECSRPVPMRLEHGEWVPGRCKLHPTALRMSAKLRSERGAKFFAAIRAAVDAATEPVARSFSGGNPGANHRAFLPERLGAS